MSEQELTLERKYSTARRRVFDAWTRPPLLRKWAFAAALNTTKSVRVDLFPGGCLELIQRDGLDESRRWGRFQEVHAPGRLTFSWRSNEPVLNGTSTRVTLAIEGSDRESRLTLVHEGLPDAKARDACRQAWESLLDSLEAVLASP